MKEWNLQVILDKETAGDVDLVRVAIEVINGGVRCIQLRDKVSSDKVLLEEAKKIRDITKEGRCLFIVNDRVDIAVASCADGVHLGQEDLPYKEARRLLGRDKIIGVSTHNIEQAALAQIEGADYIGVGPIFATQTKSDLKATGLNIVSRVSKEIRILSVFIGGINLINIHEIIKRGGRYAAVASAILKSDNISETTRSFVDILQKGETSQQQNGETSLQIASSDEKCPLRAERIHRCLK